VNQNLKKCIDAACNYKQGYVYLKRNGLHDFLGVIADQYINQNGGEWVDCDDGTIMGKTYSRDGVMRIKYPNGTYSKVSTLDYHVAEWAGLNQSHIDLIITMNDRHRKSFKEVGEKLMEAM
jgi:hypothetical protein